MTELVEVIQADREAAAGAVRAYRGEKNANWQGRIRRGEVDDGEMVQAFARHRIAHSPPAQTGFAPCPTCRQYSHSIGEDRLAEAFNHFQSMFSHRGDGIPTQYNFDEKTRDAAQVLMAAARSSPPSSGERVTELEEALKPFADAADNALAQFDSGVTVAILNRVSHYFTEWTHYQRARQALQRPSHKEGV